MLRPDGKDALTDRISDCLQRLDVLLAGVAERGEDPPDAARALAGGTDELRRLVDALLCSNGGRGVPTSDPRRP